jgi:uncharacterized membrane protein YbhN (UPF0104 family)
MLLSTSLRMPGTGVRSLIGEIAPGVGPRTPGRVWPARVLALTAAGIFAFLAMAHGGQFVHALKRALHADWHLVAVAVALEAASVAGYVLLLHRVVARANPKLRLRDSYDMTLGGAAATRLLPTAGLGGAAVTVWALRARGVRTGELAERLLAFLLLLYGVYLSALLAGGAVVAFALGHVTHGRSLGVLGAAIAAALAATVLVASAAPSPVARAVTRVGRRFPRLGSASRWVAMQLPVLAASRRRAWHEVRRPHPALLGTVAYWAFDLGVLAAMLHAFGVGLPLAEVVLAYFLGTLFNVVPLPGSLSGGLAGTLIALGSPAGAAIAAVLAYRALAVWLPAVPGVASLASLRTSVASWRMDTASRTPARQFAV